MAEQQNRTWTDSYLLRMPDGMRDELKAAAKKAKRSLNSEIVARLQGSLTAEDHEEGVAIRFNETAYKKLLDVLAEIAKDDASILGAHDQSVPVKRSGKSK